MYGNRYVCEYCGAYNDPGEHCECQSKRDTAIRKRHAKNGIIRKLEESEWMQEELKICY